MLVRARSLFLLTLAISLTGVVSAQPLIVPGAGWTPPGTPAPDVRYSVVPDGVFVPADLTPFGGISAGPNQIVELMNTALSTTGGFPRFVEIVRDIAAAYTDEAGITLNFVGNMTTLVDDGAALGSPASTRRGDIRIVARPFIAPYAQIPVLVSPPGFGDYEGEIALNTNYQWQLQGSPQLEEPVRIYVQNAIGQAIGLTTYCPGPAIGTMMGGFESTAITDPIPATPTHTDILALQYLYGDAFEGNDTAQKATELTLLQNGQAISPCAPRTPGGAARSRCGIRSEEDLDFFQVTIAESSALAAIVSAQGLEFTLSTRCSPSLGPSSEAQTLRSADLSLKILGPAPSTDEIALGQEVPGVDGTLLLATASLQPGSYYIVVGGANFDPVATTLPTTPQLYSLTISATAEQSPGVCPGDTNGDGEVNFADLNTVLGNFGSVCP